jgi:choline dehydrogenase-like flavoprotein
MGGMPKVPDSTKSSLAYKISARARERWPQLTSVDVTHRAGFAYLTATLPDGQQMPLCRLRYGGSASIWGFSIYRASHDDYQSSMLPTGMTAGSPEDALDCACGLYLGDPTAWITPPKN